jgi:regulator of cell morphogenesis and NO signaling
MQETKAITDMMIGEIVAEDYRTAAIFEKHGIDFCCGGKIPLATICASKAIDLACIAREIEDAKSTPVTRSENYAGWSLSFLIDYIINNHHTYLNENTKPIAVYARKIASVHGGNHHEVVQISTIFDKLAGDLVEHLREEEDVFFPAVKRAEAAIKENAKPEERDLETIQRSLAKLSREHEVVGDAIHRIRHLARGFEIPVGVCNTFAVTYRKLNDFEDDIHKHVHLENNILFPKAAQL